MTQPILPAKDLVQHKDDIQRQAIELYKLPTFFRGAPKYMRWKFCIRMVADTWMRLGPQAYRSGPVIYL